jgi:hypothetical protein
LGTGDTDSDMMRNLYETLVAWERRDCLSLRVMTTTKQHRNFPSMSLRHAWAGRNVRGDSLPRRRYKSRLGPRESKIMTEWIYRATPKRADWGTTVDCLTEYNFLCRTAYAQPNKKSGTYQLVANVREVGFGDLIHIAFSTNGGYERLGSFEILDNDHPDQEGPIDHGKHGRLSLFRVCEKTALGQMLAATSYRRDPKLGVFTGWHVREVELREIAFLPGMFPGKGSLYPVTPWQESYSANSFPSTRRTLKKFADQLAKGMVAPIALPKSGRFIGVDWSGALRAGRKIWAAAICCTEEKPPKVEFVKRPFTGLDAGGVASKFADCLESESFVAAGLDFCFGVSQSHPVSGRLEQVRPRSADGSPTDIALHKTSRLPSDGRTSELLTAAADRHLLLPIFACFGRHTGAFLRSLV